MNVRDKGVLITGAAGGLGSAMARQLCQRGARVVISDVDDQAGQALADALVAQGHWARYVRLEVTSEAAWQEAAAFTQAECGRLDVLVNNAGINIRKPIEQMSIEEWMKMMAVNTGSVFLGCKTAIPLMRAQGGGSIINISSVCGLIGHRYTPEAYTASKGAVTLLTKSIAARHGADNIRCNSVHPSTVDTPLVRQMLGDPDWAAQRLGEVPLGRLASDLDVAHLVCFLASDGAAFINGAALPVDGGVTAY
ncbi:MAG: glucose 1-dehydrogenase [Clostridiales bacterium]|nr:glucose 1-dehydrogenase [Clostridiales bacterium]